MGYFTLVYVGDNEDFFWVVRIFSSPQLRQRGKSPSVVWSFFVRWKKTPVFWGGRPIAMFDQRVIYVNLVGGIPTPLKNMSSSAGMMKFPIYGKIKNVPNHQPVNLRYPATPSAFYFWLRSANFPTFCGILWQIFRK